MQFSIKGTLGNGPVSTVARQQLLRVLATAKKAEKPDTPIEPKADSKP
jgi:hypothetical protein